ncbi:FAD-binding oxidoreductase [Catenuloplanes japonicus]|uniref:FAD-binding oxidoreductase n=1 Tax=Catenuloplanes japonicus TaxID=33876 RepID=UPI000524D9AC|nr:FAD-binding oxidoreductase [Catenuloplanes japonicus]
MLHPGDDGFDEAGEGWLRTVTHRPAAVMIATCAEDVVEAVRFAVKEGRPVAVQSTGHGVSVPADDAVLINTSRMRHLTVDPAAGTARIGAGLRWEDVIAATAPHGLAPLCGSSGGVGVMGFLTGGGLPLTCRTHGFAAGHVRSLDIVTADGQVRTVSDSREPELFRAARGGKGNVGIVVSAEIVLVPSRTIYGGLLAFPGLRAAEVLHAYGDWTRVQPDTVSSSVTLLCFPDVPQLPAEFRGRSVVQVRVIDTGDGSSAGPLRALGPESDTFGAMPYAGITGIHQDPKGPVTSHLRSALLRDLDGDAVETLVANMVAPFNVELRQLGGALDRPASHAVSTQGAAFHLWVRMPAGAEEQAATLLERLRPWDTGAMLPGFLFDADADPARVRRAYSATDYARLVAVKRRYDPANVFRINHNIPPGDEII